GEPDGRADLHSLGVVLYELATGQHPYRDEDTSKVLHNILDVEPRKAGEVTPQLSPFFEEVVQTLIAKDPEQRFPAAANLALVLEEGETSEWWRERAKALRIQTKRPLRRIRIPRETALYGRDDDLAKIHSLYDKAKAGDGQVLLIEGEAGIGKTRLVDEFAGLLGQAAEDFNFLFGSYPPGGAATAAGAFSTAYRKHFEDEGLEKVLETYLARTPRLVPAFAALLRGTTLPADAERLTRESLQTVFVHATHALAEERPTVVLIDDLHFAPREGLGIFASLALAVPGHRILLVGTARSGLPEAWKASVLHLEQASHLPLGRLGAKDLAKLLDDAFQSKRMAQELSHRIALKSDGNPFFAFEIIRGLREMELIVQTPGGAWVTTRTIEEIRVPSTVADLVAARLATLDDDQKNLLDVASCCGFEFDPLVVAEVLGLEQIPAMQRLAKIEQIHRLVHSAGRRFAFDHHQVQEALYEGLPELLREPYHASIAEAMERSALATEGDAKKVQGALCVDLCEHFLKGGRGERALRYFDAALEHLEQGYLNDQAAALADRALRSEGLLRGERRLRVMLRREQRLHLMGRREEQHALLSEARALAEAGGHEELLWQIGTAESRLLEAQGRYVEATDLAQQGLAFVAASGDREREAAALANLGMLLHHQGSLVEAREHQERALTLAREIGHVAGETTATRLLGDLCKELGLYEQAEGHYLRARELAQAGEFPIAEIAATGCLGNLYQSMGDAARARESYEHWLTLASEMGHRQSAAGALGNLGILHLAAGRLVDAREHFERHQALARELGDRQGEVNATGNLGLLFSAAGQLAKARALNQRALDLARAIGSKQAEGYIAGNLAEVLLSLGCSDEAHTLAQRLHDLATDAEAPRAMAYGQYLLSRLAESDDDMAAAHAWASSALEHYRSLGEDSRTAGVLVRLGDLEAQLGHADAAVALLTEGLEVARRGGDGDTAVLAMALLAREDREVLPESVAALEGHADAMGHEARMYVSFTLWSTSGDHHWLVEAKRLLDHLVEHAPEEHRESMLKNVRLNREIMEAWAEHGEASTA
ncbi:MAG: ATP-binding protein, partial [Planctomycetota bacterium]